jgi:hypothetical protein
MRSAPAETQGNKQARYPYHKPRPVEHLAREVMGKLLNEQAQNKYRSVDRPESDQPIGRLLGEETKKSVHRHSILCAEAELA